MRAAWGRFGRALFGVAVAALVGTALLFAFSRSDNPTADWFLLTDPFDMCGYVKPWDLDEAQCLAGFSAEIWLRIFLGLSIVGVPIYVALRRAGRASLPAHMAAWGVAGFLVGTGWVICSWRPHFAEFLKLLPIIGFAERMALLIAIGSAIMAVAFRLVMGALRGEQGR